MSKSHKSKKMGDSIDIEDAVKVRVVALCDEMEEAIINDHENNKNGKPAFLRFKLLKKIENTLRIQNVQETFLNQ